MHSMVVMYGNGPFSRSTYMVTNITSLEKPILLPNSFDYMVYQGLITVNGKRYRVQSIISALDPVTEAIWTGKW